MLQRVAIGIADRYNDVEIKSALGEIFDLLGYDRENPFGKIIAPGSNVFIKPNWVASRWRASCSHDGDIYSVITHPAVIEAVADYVAIALNGSGSITIGDNPSIDADFDELLALTGVKRLETKYDIECRILDLRPLVCRDLRDYGVKERMHAQPGDPNGITQINLGSKSMLHGVNPRLFRGVFTDRSETTSAHRGDTQLYTFSNSIYNADVYISIPKMKTHHKVGTTLNLKGLVGAVATKNQLVHWRVGFPLLGGDEYSSLFRWVKSKFARVQERGAWYGNDTIWRMVVDLYNAFRTRKRAVFSIVDGIVGGEGKGPFCPDKKHSNVLVAGEDLLSVDLVTTRLMGFEPTRIPYLAYLMQTEPMTKADIKVLSTTFPTEGFFESTERYLNYCPPREWKRILV